MQLNQLLIALEHFHSYRAAVVRIKNALECITAKKQKKNRKLLEKKEVKKYTLKMHQKCACRNISGLHLCDVNWP